MAKKTKKIKLSIEENAQIRQAYELRSGVLPKISFKAFEKSYAKETIIPLRKKKKK